MNDRPANVWFEDRIVGRLREKDREFYLTYDPLWLEKDPFSISVSLPLSEDEQYAHTFFAGLLPEGGARERTCRLYGIDNRDDVGLLLAIGEDCAGALSIVANESENPSSKPEKLSADELALIVNSKGQWKKVGQESRFSLAGAQEKQPVILTHGDYFVPNRRNPSTHILKFETIPGVCFAEYLANQLAKTIGLTCVDTKFKSTDDGTPYLLISRYDRRVNSDNGSVNRIHQEDVLQAIGEPTALKYEADGGPSLAVIAALIKDSTAEPASSIQRLRDWQIFNFLIGNWDGHAKNLSLVYTEHGSAPFLAPFYDLVAIEYFNTFNTRTWARKLAFRIGLHDTPEEVNLEDWREFASTLDIPARPLFERIREISQQLDVEVEGHVNKFNENYHSHPNHNALIDSVRKRCRWLTNQFRNAKG